LKTERNCDGLFFMLEKKLIQKTLTAKSMNNNQQFSLGNLLTKSFPLLVSISIVTGGISLSLTDKTLASSLLPADKASFNNDASTVLAMVSRTEFLAEYPAGTVLCFNDRSVENKVQIVDFNQSFQVVDFVYLDGGSQGQKGSADYSTFVYNSYQCSY
jgi:hypothetical protein